MFSSLDEQMNRDECASSSARERWIRYAAIAVASALVFGGLYASLMFIE